MTVKLPDIVEEELKPLAGRWSVKNGGKHLKLFVDDRLVGILSRGNTREKAKDRSAMNLRSNIRRHLAEVSC